MSETAGRVFLVGAGPGDPGLLTLRAAECLGSCDVVLYDYLVGEENLKHARTDAKLVCLGRHGHGRVLSQEEINALVVQEARAGKRVARLKGGDPAVFGRLAEEVEALETAGVSYEIVPGVTAASAAAAYAGVPLTNRENASCVAFVTGQECRGKQNEPLDLGALAKFPGTLVIYMGVTTAPDWSSELVKHGKAADTPVAVVRRVSLPDQSEICTTLGELPEVLSPGAVRPPALIVIGETVSSRAATSWFTGRPLFGKTVLVTRPESPRDQLSQNLASLGARVLHQPAIEISRPEDWQPVDRVIERLGEFDWLVFSSVNGVNGLLDRIQELGLDLRVFGSNRIASIGPATTSELARRGLRADVQADTFRAEGLVEVLAPEAAGQRFLLLRASRGREFLAGRLQEAGGEVEQVVVYRSTDTGAASPEIAEQLAAGRIDWTTVTSSAIAHSLVSLLGDGLRKTRLVAISPLTAAALSELGYAADAVAERHDSEGVVQAILAADAAL